jgi:putative PEP-CTERM system TPR-repeat lipoprotein
LFVATIYHAVLIRAVSEPRARRAIPYRGIMAFCLVALLTSGCRQAPAPSEHFKRASELEGQNDLSGAVVELKTLLSVEPDNKEARWRLGHLYVRTGYGEGALKELTRAENMGLVNEAVTRYRFQALLMTQAFQTVLDELGRDSLLGPKQRMEFEAQARFGLGQFGQAKKLFEGVLKARPERQPPMFKLALIAKYNGQLSVAERYLDGLIHLNQQHLTAWYYKADIRLRLNDFNGASAAYEQVLKLDPGQIGASLGLVKVALAQGNNLNANILLAPVLKRYPNFVSANYLAALSKLQQDKGKQAQSMLKVILQKVPQHQASLLLRGAIEYHQGHYFMAERLLFHAAKSADKFHGANRLLAATYLGIAAPEKAYNILLPLVEKQPEDIQLLGLLAFAQMSQGEYDQAQYRLAQAGRLVAQGAVHSAKIEVSNLGFGETEARVSEKFSAVTLQTQHSGATLVTMMAALIEQHYEQALQSGLAAVADHPDNPLLLQLLGAAHEGLENRDKAQALYEKVLLLAPSYSAARSALNRFKDKGGQASPTF